MKPHWHDEKWHFSTWIHQSQEHETHRIHRNHSIWSVTYEYLSVILILSQSLFLDLSASLVLVNHKKIDPKSLGSKSVGSWVLSSLCHQFALWIYIPAASAERPNVNAHSAKALRVHLFWPGRPGRPKKWRMSQTKSYLVGGWPTPLKNMKVSWGYNSQLNGKIKMFQTTNQVLWGYFKNEHRNRK